MRRLAQKPPTITPQKQFLPKKNAVYAPTKSAQKALSATVFNMNLPACFIYLPEETVPLMPISCRITVLPQPHKHQACKKR